MIEFLASWQNFPFSVALAMMIIIAFVEGVSLFFGASFSHLADNLGVESADFEASTLLGKLFSWFKIGQIPILILIILFLTVFGISGLILQSIFLKITGTLLPAFLVSIFALIVSFPTVSRLGRLINKIMPKDETSAVSLDSFVGRITTITLGTAKPGLAAQAKVKDSFGKYHYIMVAPDNDGEEFAQGEQVLIVRHDKNQFYVIENTNQMIND